MPEHQKEKSGRRMVAEGSAVLFAAESLLLPTGLVTASVLTRTLGPVDYGIFTLASQLVVWICWSMAAMLVRPSIKLVADHAEWQPVASTVVRVFAGGGLFGTLLFLVGASVPARLLATPELDYYLRLFSLEVILFALAQAHGAVLVARGMFRERAIASAVRILTRMFVMVGLVLGGLSVPGAVLGSISAVAADFAVCRYYVRPRLFGASTFPRSRLLSYGAPLFVFAISVRLFERIDLFAITWFGVEDAAVGVYAAAQNLSIIPTVVTLSFSPIVLSTLTRLVREDKSEEARALASDALRLAVCLLAFLGVAVGCAREIVVLLFGETFADAGTLLSYLIAAQAVMTAQSICVAVLLVAERRRAISALGLTILAIAIVGHLLLIPQLASTGAAVVTFSVSGMGACVAAVLAHRFGGLSLPVGTVLRTIVVGVGVYLLAAVWPATAAAMVATKLVILSGFVPLAFLVLGELDASDREAVAGLVHGLLGSNRTLRSKLP